MEAAQRLGVEVTVGSEEASTMTGLNPSGFLTLDFSNPDRAADQVAEFAARHPIAAVVPVDDQVAAVGAAISRRLGLPCNSVQSALAARNKFRMRELLARAGVAQPSFKLFPFTGEPAESARQVEYSCVVKPLSLAASQGVIRADNEAEFVAAVARVAAILESASRIAPRGEQYFLAEQFIPGPEVAVEGLLTRGQLRVLAVFDKPDPLDGPYFEETIYVTPSRLPATVQQAIAAVTENACRALGLVHGPVHAELRIASAEPRTQRVFERSERHDSGPTSALTPLEDSLRARLGHDSDGSLGFPHVIEINPRSIGGLCSRVLRFGTGLSLEELIIRHAIDAKFAPPEREDQAAGVMMIPIPQAGKFHGVRGFESAKAVPGIEDVTIAAHRGQQLLPLPEGSLYLGFIFASGPSPDAVEAALRAAHAALEFQIDS
jgi:biotin carboxylase